jgi:hypothetical protein
MTINLTPEQEQIIKAELKSGRFRTAEDVIAQALEALRKKEPTSSPATDGDKHREAVREMLRFVEQNRVTLQGISVRELIHEGHRL